MRRVRVYKDVQNSKPSQFVLVVDHQLIKIGGRDEIISELRTLWQREFIGSNEFRELVQCLRGK